MSYQEFLIGEFKRKGIVVPQSVKEARRLLKNDPNFKTRIE